jgi:hypothetical protein
MTTSTIVRLTTALLVGAFTAACTFRPPAVATGTPIADLPSSTAPATLTPAPTATTRPAVTNTAVTPTATATATSSPTATALLETHTPPAPATPDPNEGVGDVIYADNLDGNGGWFWGFSDDVATIGVDGDHVKALMTKANAGWRFTIGPDTLRVGNQQTRVSTHTVACGDNDEYGLLFRINAAEGESPYDGYLFKLRCSGAARFDLVRGTQSTALVDWTPSPAIKVGANADNVLTVWAAGSEFRFYANDQYLFSASDATLADGFFGLYLYDRTAGGMTVNFDDLTVRAVSAP